MTAASPLRAPLWIELRTRLSPASVVDLAGALGAPPSAISWRLSRWVAAGLLRKVPAAANAEQKRTLYLMPEAVRRQPAPPPLDQACRPSGARGGRDAMWRAIRTLRRFDLPTLVITSEVSTASAKTFVSALLRAGILRCELRGHAKTGQRSIYALMPGFGPRTPVIRQRREQGRTSIEVHDPNTGTARSISAQRLTCPLF